MAQKRLKDDHTLLTTPSFPFLGVVDPVTQKCTFAEHDYVAGGPAAQSLFLCDELINPHIRFPFVSRPSLLGLRH